MKDPAFLFYSNDFDQGTKFFTDEQTGKYIRLLICQHQHGHLSEKQVLFICKTFDSEIMQKFIQDESGMYYNSRLDSEIEKRVKHCEKQKENINKRWNKSGITKDIQKEYHGNTTVIPLENENENENTIVIDNDIKKEKLKKIKFAENVLLFQSEYDNLINELGDYITKMSIEKLNAYKGSNGKKYKSDYLAMKNWVINQVIIDSKNRSNGTSNKRTIGQPATSHQDIIDIVNAFMPD